MSVPLPADEHSEANVEADRYRFSSPPAVSFHYRAQLPLPNRLRSFFPILNNYAPVSTFAEQSDAGLSSGNFDIEAANIAAGDSRTGLDERGTQEVLDIMRRERVK